MERLIKVVHTYQVTSSLVDRIRLAEELCRLIEPDLRLFVFKAIQPPDAEDVMQETLKAIVLGLKKFIGETKEMFWGWCYQIARNKLSDHFRVKKGEKAQPMAHDELWELVESSAQVSPLSAADRHDLEYAMKLLTSSKPECHDLLWNHFVIGLAYGEIAEAQSLSYDGVRMKIGRCLDEARTLVS